MQVKSSSDKVYSSIYTFIQTSGGRLLTVIDIKRRDFKHLFLLVTTWWNHITYGDFCGSLYKYYIDFDWIIISNYSQFKRRM